MTGAGFTRVEPAFVVQAVAAMIELVVRWDRNPATRIGLAVLMVAIVALVWIEGAFAMYR